VVGTLSYGGGFRCISGEPNAYTSVVGLADWIAAKIDENS